MIIIDNEDVISALLFVITMIPLILIVRKFTESYTFTKSREKIDHLIYMDDMVIFLKKKKN